MRGENQVRLAGLDDNVIDRNRREISSFILRPVLAAIHGNPEAELGAEEEHVAIDRIFFDHVSVTANTALLRRKGGPGLAIIRGPVGVGLHVAEGVPVECGVGSGFVEAAGLDGRDPGALAESVDVGDYVRPGLRTVASDLQVAVVGADPNDLPVLRRLGDGIDGGVHLGGRVVDGDAAGLLLLLFLRIVGCEVGRDAVPRLAVIARAEEELGADVDGPFFVGAHVNGSVPIESQLAFPVIRPGMQITRLMRVAIHSANFAALRLGVEIVGIGGILEHPEAVAAEHVFPARVAHAAGIRRVAHPGAVILQAAVDAVGVGVVGADVIELRNRQVHLVFPAIATVFAAPQTAIVAGDYNVWIFRIDPDIVKVAMVGARNHVESFSAVVTQQQD